MYFYKYDLLYYDEDFDAVRVQGITTGATFAEATEQIAHYYGEDNIGTLTLGLITNELGAIEHVCEIKELRDNSCL